jgi:hypothetical protein
VLVYLHISMSCGVVLGNSQGVVGFDTMDPGRELHSIDASH